MEHSAHPSVVPLQLLPTKDAWIVICCPKDSLFRRLREALERTWMVDDERFSSIAGRERNREQCMAILSDQLRTRATVDWIHVPELAGVPCETVNDLDAALVDRQAEARGMVYGYEHDELGTVRAVAPPIRLSDGPPASRGEHTGAVLREVARLLA